MRFWNAYYPYILYSIPYVVAALVLIRARIKAQRQAERQALDEDLCAAGAAPVAKAPANAKAAPGGRRITAMLARIKSRRAA